MKISHEWNRQDSEFIRQKVIEHNMKNLPDEAKSPVEQLSFVLKDDDGTILGGITASTFWRRLHVDFLWVDERLRGQGQGKVLLEKVEQAAKEKGCRLITLDTFSFQAPDFYKRNGYEVFGMLEDHPKGFSQCFLQKRLEN
ncbi:GNAT family N-acetyltransferase [Planococcus maitriensis]|uniref:GNAT family N-acetyltransferase n=1 Tax=Planococcus maitriensis TaxID=221799 RepID=A0A365K4U4_9BACL|nr:GNAT family N-acetyltransferase [Planococcus maitriensis]RAZ67667.1 GNAT family N-acetyltransferase [Planococcus maitriensis]